MQHARAMRGVLLASAVVIAAAQAEDPAKSRWARPEAGRGGFEGPLTGGERSMRFDRNMLLFRVLNNSNVLAEAGIANEQAERIRARFVELEEREIDIGVELRKAGLQQAELLAAPDVNEAELMAAVQRVGDLRTELAKLSIERILVVREALTPEQIERAKKLALERIQKIRQGMDGRSEHGEHRTGRDRRERRERDRPQASHPEANAPAR